MMASHKAAVDGILRQHGEAVESEMYDHSIFMSCVEEKPTANGWTTIIWMRDGSRREVTTMLTQIDGGLRCETSLEAIPA